MPTIPWKATDPITRPEFKAFANELKVPHAVPLRGLAMPAIAISRGFEAGCELRAWLGMFPPAAHATTNGEYSQKRTDMMTFQKEITTDDGETLTLERTGSDDAADAVNFRAQGWSERSSRRCLTPPASTQLNRD